MEDINDKNNTSDELKPKEEQKTDGHENQEINNKSIVEESAEVESDKDVQEQIPEIDDIEAIRNIIKNRKEEDPGSSMNYDNPLYKDARSCAVKIICRYERSDAYIDKLIDNELKFNPYLNDFDKSLLNELVHGVVRWIRRLDWFLNGFYRGNYEKCVPEIKNAMRVALYQIMFLNKIPYSAAVNEAVEFVKRIHGEKHAGVVNGLLRTIIRTLDALVWPTREIDEANYLGIIQSHPNWLVKRWIQRFGFDETQKLCEANNKRPALTLRYNPLKITEQEFSEYLNQKGVIYSKANYLQEFFNVKIFSKFQEDEYFKNGYFSIQDESAGLISYLVDPKENELILDACAAPGGKTIHMSEISRGKAYIVAVDKYLSRAEAMKRNIDRYKLTNVTILYDDISNPTTEILKSKIVGKVDKVLVDAPCSGFGVISKKPEIKWKRDSKDIPKLQKIQLEILESSVKYLKPGGSIIYSTCTIEQDENADVIHMFLEKHPEFTIVNAKDFVNENVVNQEGFIETFPHIHHIDGAFGARLKMK